MMSETNSTQTEQIPPQFSTNSFIQLPPINLGTYLKSQTYDVAVQSISSSVGIPIGNWVKTSAQAVASPQADPSLPLQAPISSPYSENDTSPITLPSSPQLAPIVSPISTPITSPNVENGTSPISAPSAAPLAPLASPDSDDNTAPSPDKSWVWILGVVLGVVVVATIGVILIAIWFHKRRQQAQLNDSPSFHYQALEVTE